jgi:hypothetical protein
MGRLTDLADRLRVARDYDKNATWDSISLSVPAVPPPPVAVPSVAAPAVATSTPEPFVLEPVQPFAHESFVKQAEAPKLPVNDNETPMKIWALETAEKRKGGATANPDSLPRSYGREANEIWAAQSRAMRDGEIAGEIAGEITPEEVETFNESLEPRKLGEVRGTLLPNETIRAELFTITMYAVENGKGFLGQVKFARGFIVEQFHQELARCRMNCVHLAQQGITPDDVQAVNNPRDVRSNRLPGLDVLA